MLWNREKRKRTADDVIKSLRAENLELRQRNLYLEQLLIYIKDKAESADKTLHECPEYQRKCAELAALIRQHTMTPEEALRILEITNET